MLYRLLFYTSIYLEFNLLLLSSLCTAILALAPYLHKDQWGKHLRQIIFRFRRKIETVFSQLTCQMNGEQVLARSFWGLCNRVRYKIFAHNLAMAVNFCTTGFIFTASLKALVFGFLYWHYGLNLQRCTFVYYKKDTTTANDVQLSILKNLVF